eukprot:8399915-Pyramimonas_sp.AAC.1
MLRCQEGAGNLTLSLDNHVRVVTGPYAAGAEIFVDRGDFTDAETLFKFHAVYSPAPRPVGPVPWYMPPRPRPIGPRTGYTPRVHAPA